MINRRSLLKLFGAGACAAPVVNGLVDPTRLVEIVSPPKVQPLPEPKIIEARTIAGGMLDFEEFEIVAHLRSLRSSPEFTMTVSGRGFLEHSYASEIDITSHGESYRRFIPGLCDPPSIRFSGGVKIRG